MRILLGVGGSIAAYKACELVSLAMKAGHTVDVVMTRNATRFVGALTFEGLSGRPVHLDSFSDAMSHIELARAADVAIVAPLTANGIGKIACGLADDALSTALMAVPAGIPIVLAPAMNTRMWDHPVVQRNLGWIADLGRYHLVDPLDKRLACGEEGLGGLAEPATILAMAEALGRSGE